MSETTRALNDIIDFMSRPLFSIGSTGISIDRILLTILVVLAIAQAAGLSERALQRLAARRPQQFSEASAYALGRIARYLLLIIGLVLVLETSGLNFSTLAVVGGGLGIGIGFGLQTLFANFVSGIVLLLDRSLKVGDFVDLQSGIRGRVVEIAIRYTRVSTNDSVDVLVPNSEFINGRVTNWTFDDTNRRIHIPFSVAYGTDKNLAREAGLAAARAVAGVILEEGRRAPDVWLVGFGDNSLNFELVVWVSHSLAAAPGRTSASFYWALEDELRARTIEIPFPQRDLHIRSGGLRVEVVPSQEKPAPPA